MGNCDVITKIPFVIEILLSFFKRGSESKLYISSECQKVEVSARKSAVLLSDPRLKKSSTKFYVLSVICQESYVFRPPLPLRDG